MRRRLFGRYNVGNSSRSVLIAGLKRSGTTILWETLRQDAASLCLDEPFHPDLWAGRRQNGKKTWAELGAAWNREDYATRGDLSPIQPLDELESHTSDAQRRYLADLQALSERTVIDEVRIWNRLPELLPADGRLVVVHLVRQPENWVTGHMIPLAKRRKGLAGLLSVARFFRRAGGFNNWHYEDVFNAAIAQNHPMWSSVSIAMGELARQPAYVKLLAFWWASNLVLHRRLAAWSGGPVLTVSMAEFANDPAGVIARIYGAAGWAMPDTRFDFGAVRPVRPSFKAGSRRWHDAFKNLGMPAAFLADPAMDGSRVAALFDTAD